CALWGRIPSGPGGTSSDRRARPVVGDHRGGGRAVCHRPWPGDTVEPASASSAVLPRRGGGTGPIPGRGRFAAAGGDAIVLVVLGGAGQLGWGSGCLRALHLCLGPVHPA